MNKIWILVLILIFLASCKNGIEVDKSTTDPFESILKISNGDDEVRSVLQNVDYTIQVKEVNEKGREEMPYLYTDLTGVLYKVTYQTGKFDLIVITDDDEVLEVFVINKVKI
jgi:hypothetical protein|tara:strand:- start:82 stop:417 length:336 start_codon:yes stop_codon:yes gene_type:complete